MFESELCILLLSELASKIWTFSYIKFVKHIELTP